MNNKNKSVKPELPVLHFETVKALNDWMEKNHHESAGIWLRIFKNNSGVLSVNYDQALDEALCFGWIDGQLKPLDEQSYLRKFTPRRSRSMWSKRNIEHIKRLESEGRMRPSGIKEAETAKNDGRWDLSYDSPSNMSVPEDFLKELSKDRAAAEFFSTLNKANKYAIAWRLQTAKKPETREKRMKAILAMLSKGQKFH